MSDSSHSSARCLTGLFDSGIKLLLLLLLLHCCEHYKAAQAQTEGDTGYDYGDLDDNDYYDESAISRNPVFDIPVANVTVVEGQTALLPCSIEHLGKYKVAWLERGSYPLTLDEKRVTDDIRFTVVRPQTKEWNLQIRDVKPTDAGQYRCTVNNQLILSKIVTLSVKVPAKIMDNQSTAAVLTIGEGETLALECNVTGTPKPHVTWRRFQTKDSSNCTAFRPGIVLHTGRKFVIRNISRNCGDIYECTADNGVRAPATRSFTVRVEFAPQIVLPNRRLGQVPGRDTILECRITARPQVSNYWVKGSESHAVHSHSTRHSVDIFEDGGPDSVILSLRINEISDDDYGDYQCIATNPHGRDEKTMTLFEYKEPEKQEDLQSRSSAISYDYFGGNISKEIFTGREPVVTGTGAKVGYVQHSRGSRNVDDLVGRWLRALLLTSAFQWLSRGGGEITGIQAFSLRALHS